MYRYAKKKHGFQYANCAILTLTSNHLKEENLGDKKT